MRAHSAEGEQADSGALAVKASDREGANMAAHTGSLVTSIIIPCFNQLELTRHCLRALLRHTRPPWEPIVIDNGSTDGTGTYLAGVQDSSPAPVTVIANGVNRGFPAAINQGLQVARGEYLVLLNNDAVVTDSWLDQLIALANARATTNGDQEGTTKHAKHTKGNSPGEGTTESTEGTKGERDGTTNQTNLTNKKGSDETEIKIGLVGPMSNYASPPQLVENVPCREVEEMHAFARRWREEHRGKWFTAAKLSGFCLLMKRAVYETIGGLDGRFGLGFSDDDLAERARRAGFELAVAHDLFIPHFGSRTFAGNGIDTERQLQQNGREFAEKWGTMVGNGRAVPLSPWTGQPRIEERQNQPRMNTDLHGWDSGTRKPPPVSSVGGSQAEGADHLSDPCSIRCVRQSLVDLVS